MSRARLTRLIRRAMAKRDLLPAEVPGRLVERWTPVAEPEEPADPADVDAPGAMRARPRRYLAVAAGFAVIGALVSAVVLVGARPAAEQAPPLPAALADAPRDGGGAESASPSAQPSGQPDKLVVSVVGKVGKPGLVRVRPGARVADAVAAAGGAEPGADLSTVNLARKLVDGEQIYVGVPAPAGVSPEPGGQAGPRERLNLNTATSEQLQELSGVGEVTARRILDFRARHGGFTAVEQLREVDGIGERRLANLREQVTVG